MTEKRNKDYKQLGTKIPSYYFKRPLFLCFYGINRYTQHISNLIILHLIQVGQTEYLLAAVRKHGDSLMDFGQHFSPDNGIEYRLFNRRIGLAVDMLFGNLVMPYHIQTGIFYRTVQKVFYCDRVTGNMMAIIPKVNKGILGNIFGLWFIISYLE